MYNQLLSVGIINKVKIKNRLVMSPMGMGLANLDGTVSDEQIAFYEARAKGGAGLIIPEITRVNDEHGAGMARQLSVTKDIHVKSLAKLVKALHRHDTKIFIQLHHPGREGITALNKNGQPVVSASAMPCKVSCQETRALEICEIKSLVLDFIKGAARAKEAGCDGVELHAAHGYLLQQFLSPYTNKRTDEYGGNFENRIRMISEIITGIRKECGDDFPVGIRLSVDEFLKNNNVTEDYIHLQDGIEIAQALEKEGVDFIDVSLGLYETAIVSVEPVSFPQGWRLGWLQAIKSSVNIPIIGVSVFREPGVAEDFLYHGVLDFVSSGRSWLADAEWGLKIREDRELELRKCISCMRCIQSAEENAPLGLPVECAQSPTTCRELHYGNLGRAPWGKSVLIIGAGPAGLCAAETLTNRGVNVVILESQNEIGGTVNLAKRPPYKERMQWLMDYYQEILKKPNVTIIYNIEATSEMVKAFQPDAVIIATGSSSIIPTQIPGVKGDNIYSIQSILTGKPNIKNTKVVIIGAGISGIETADFLCNKGNQVVIADVTDKIAPTAHISNVVDICCRLDKYGAKFLLKHKLKAANMRGVILERISDGAEIFEPANAIVLSLGFKPVNTMADQLAMTGLDVHVIGSAKKDGNIANATRTGYEIGRKLFT